MIYWAAIDGERHEGQGCREATLADQEGKTFEGWNPKSVHGMKQGREG